MDKRLVRIFAATVQAISQVRSHASGLLLMASFAYAFLLSLRRTEAAALTESLLRQFSLS